MNKIIKTKWHSYRIGKIADGCKFCVEGSKEVIFITGICPRHCFYCPLSEQKYQKDVIFANERPVKTFKDIKTEAKLMKAKGAGLTGGDPLTKLKRTIHYIKQFKKHFGKKFHLHLYTSLNLINEKNLKQLYSAGLDEIRFHLDLDNQELWPKLSLAKKFPWHVGVEVPCLLEKQKQLKGLIDFIHNKADFLNLNELELADTSISQLRRLGHKPKDQLSYAVLGSEKLGLNLLQYIQKKKYSLKTHLCTVKLKDAVQLTNRIKREAQQAKKPFDTLDSEGMLIRGALYLPQSAPSFLYQQKLKKANKTRILKKLIPIKNKIKRKLKLTKNQISLDKQKPRILLSRTNLKKHKNYFKKLDLVTAIVKEYPTYDSLEVEIDFL